MSTTPASFEGVCLYEMLGVQKNATVDDIRRAYKRQALVLHPDKNKSADAVHKFQAMQRAYEVLKDDAKRAAYDQGGMERLKKFEEGRDFPGFKALFTMIVLAYATMAGVPRHVKCHAAERSPRLLKYASVLSVWAAVIVALVAVTALHVWIVPSPASGPRRCSLSRTNEFNSATQVSFGHFSTTMYGAGGACEQASAVHELDVVCRRIEQVLLSAHMRLPPTVEVDEVLPSGQTFRRFTKKSAKRPWYSKFVAHTSYTMSSASMPTLPRVCSMLQSRGHA